jgi:hypothetical protein
MTKVGIVTFFKANNYGAVLQCYCLQEYLKKSGYDVHILDSPNKEERKKNSLRWKLREKLISRPFIKFRNKYFDKIENVPQCDVYIFGSDQIWNTDITKENAKFYFGNTIPDNVKKISYAASFGTSTWSADRPLTEEIKTLLSSFDGIGVREKSGVSICKEQFNLQATQVLDPTFLVDSLPKMLLPMNLSNVMTCYLFNKSKQEINCIKSIAKETNLRPQILNDVRLRPGIKSVPYPSVPTWLSNIYSSDLIITDSFHCMVFAIKAKRDFFAVPAIKTRAGRMTSLLESIGLSHRYFESLEAILQSDELLKPIFYNDVTEKLNELESYSKNFIEKVLKK